MEHADDLKPRSSTPISESFAGIRVVNFKSIIPLLQPLEPASAGCYVSRSLVGPTSPVHHGTNAFILHVAPWAFSSFSKIP